MQRYTNLFHYYDKKYNKFVSIYVKLIYIKFYNFTNNFLQIMQRCTGA